MKKLIIKTALITFSVTIILAVSIFGIISFVAPSVMVNFTASIGLESISGDYAFQEYQRSGDISYLARSFEIAAKEESEETALARFDELIANEGFDGYCAEQDKLMQNAAISYKNYVLASGTKVKYRLARTDSEKEAVFAFAAEHTAPEFEKGNPVLSLCIEAASKKDKAFAGYLLGELEKSEYQKNDDFVAVVKILSDTVGQA